MTRTCARTTLAAAALLLAGTAMLAGAASLTWNQINGTWDTTTPNWAPGPTTFTNGIDDVTFSNTAGGTITISPGMNPTGTTVSAALDTCVYTFTGSPIIGGTFTKSGTCDVYLNNVASGGNAFTSATLGAGGAGNSAIYFYNSANPLGNGTTTFVGSVQLWAGSTGYYTTWSNQIDWNHNVTVSFQYNNAVFNGLVRMGGQGNIGGGGTNAVTFNGLITDMGAARGAPYENGPPTYLLNDGNTFSGRVGIQGGTIYFTSITNVGGGASSMGQYTVFDGNERLLLGSGGGLCTYGYIGTAPGGHSTDRALYYNSNGPETGKYTAVDASGVGPLQLTSANLYYTSNNARWLTFTGTNTGNNLLAAAINNSGAFMTNVEKTNSGKWIFTGASPFTGTLSVSRSSYAGGVYAYLNYNSGGELVFRDSGAATGTTAVSLNRGTLTLDNTGTANIERINNAAPVTLAAGTVRLLGAAASSTETLGNVTLNAGQSTISVANNTAASTLALGTITRNANGAVNFTATGGTLGAGGANPAITTTSGNDATGILGTWATVNGADWATVGANGITAYSGYAALSDGTGGPITDTNNSRLTGSQTQVGSVTTNSLKIAPSGAGQALALGANGLTLTGGALLLAGNDFTVGGSGTLRAPAGKELTLNAESGRTLQIDAVVGGDTGLNKTGAGTLVLGNSGNSYTGGTNVYQGALRGDTGTIKGAVFVDTGASVAFNQASDGTQPGAISGTGALVKDGTAKLLLNTANPYSGGTYVNAGKLQFNKTTGAGTSRLGTAPVYMANGTALRFEGASSAESDVIGNSIVIADGATATLEVYGQNNYTTSYNGVISGGTLANPVTLVLRAFAPSYWANMALGTANTFTGHVEIRDTNMMSVSGPASLGAATNDVHIVGTPAWLQYTGLRFSAGTYTIPQSIKLTGYSLLENNGTKVTLSGDITDGGSGNGIAYLRGAGETVLTGTNSPTQWLVYGDAVKATVFGQANLGSAPFVISHNAAGAAVKFAGANPGTFTNTFNNASGNANMKMTLNVEDPVATATLTGAVSSAATLILEKLGSGRLDLNGSLNNTGPTQVNGGRLNVNVVTAANQGSYTVASGATLGGMGTINLGAGKSITVSSGGLLAPGTSPGTLTVTGGNLAMGAGSTAYLEFAGTGAGQFDAITVTGGTLDLSAVDNILDVTILSPYYSQAGDTFRIVNATSVSGFFDTLRWNGWTTGSVYTVAYDVDGALLTFNVSIPEPGALALLGLATGVLALRRRRG